MGLAGTSESQVCSEVAKCNWVATAQSHEKVKKTSRYASFLERETAGRSYSVRVKTMSGASAYARESSVRPFRKATEVPLTNLKVNKCQRESTWATCRFKLLKTI